MDGHTRTESVSGQRYRWHRPGPSRRGGGGRRWWALGAVSLATFITGLDNSVVNVALPTIQRELGLGLSGLEWVVSGYVLAFAGLMLVGGRAADIYGRRRVFRTGLAVFTAASLLAGLAPTGAALITARVAQGVGAAVLTPAALAILPAAFPGERERNRAVGIWTGVSALALALGPVTGGWIAQHWAWGWIFWINVPLGALAYTLAGHAITPTGPGRHRALDLPGLATSTLALLALTYGLIEGPGQGWSRPAIWATFTIAAAAAVGFVATQARGQARGGDPMIDVRLFTQRVFVGGTLATGLWAFGVFGVYFFIALYLQNVLGLSPVQAGAAFVPLALVMVLVAALAAPVAARVGTRVTVAAALAIMAAAIGGAASVGEHASLSQLMPWLLAYGVGAGLLVPLNSAILGMLPAARAGIASGLLNLTREVFGLLGVTVLGAVLTVGQTDRLRTGHSAVSAFVSGYQLALLVAAGIVAAGIPIALHTFHNTAHDNLPTTPPTTPFGIRRAGAATTSQPSLPPNPLAGEPAASRPGRWHWSPPDSPVAPGRWRPGATPTDRPVSAQREAHR